MTAFHPFRCLLADLMLCGSGLSLAQNYPDRPITIIVPFTPGGVSDITARPLSVVMSSDLGQSVIIDNKGGAGGAIGMAAAAKAKPDGYTLLMALPSYITTDIPDDVMKAMFERELRNFYGWLPSQSHLQLMNVSYNDLLSTPAAVVNRISEFLGGDLNVQSMTAMINPELYRQRAA